MCQIILKDNFYDLWNFTISPVAYNGGSIKTATKNQFNTGFESFLNIQIDGKLGVLVVTNPTRPGEDKKVIAAIPSGNQLFFFTTNIIQDMGNRTSGYDLDYVYKVLSTIKFN